MTAPLKHPLPAMGGTPAKPTPEFLPLIDINHPKVMPEPNSGCWLWLGYLENGYGRVRRKPTQARSGFLTRAMHRVAYEQAKGPVPSNMTLDHLCRVRCCVNPDHLEPTSPEENYRRGKLNGNKHKTHCKRGHLLSGENLKMRQDGKRECRQCDRAMTRDAKRAYKQRLREKKAAVR